MPERNDQNWLQFKEWLNGNKVDMSKVTIDWIDDRQGFGLKANNDIKESEVILEIPRKVMISCETALQNKDLGIYYKFIAIDINYKKSFQLT